MLGLRPAAAALLAALGVAAGAALSAGRRGYEIEMRGEGSSEEKETKLPSKSEKGTTDKESEEERPLVVDIVAEAKGENCSSARSPAAAVMDADAAVAAAEASQWVADLRRAEGFERVVLPEWERGDAWRLEHGWRGRDLCHAPDAPARVLEYWYHAVERRLVGVAYSTPRYGLAVSSSPKSG